MRRTANRSCKLHFLGMELAANAIFLVLPSVNNDLFIYLCLCYKCGLWNHIRRYYWIEEYFIYWCWGYLYVQIKCERNLDAQIKDLDAQFPGWKQMCTLKRLFLWPRLCIVFLNNRLMTLSHTVFNISLDLIMTNVILCMLKPQAFALPLFWLLLIQYFSIDQDFWPLETYPKK